MLTFTNKEANMMVYLPTELIEILESKHLQGRINAYMSYGTIPKNQITALFYCFEINIEDALKNLSVSNLANIMNCDSDIAGLLKKHNLIGEYLEGCSHGKICEMLFNGLVNNYFRNLPFDYSIQLVDKKDCIIVVCDNPQNINNFI